MGVMRALAALASPEGGLVEPDRFLVGVTLEMAGLTSLSGGMVASCTMTPGDKQSLAGRGGLAAATRFRLLPAEVARGTLSLGDIA
jgi:hypothetical protein